MAIAKPEKVPQAKISSLDIASFDGGLDQRGQYNIKPNRFTKGRNVMINPQGLATHRMVLKKWLPDTVEKVHQIYPVLWNGDVYYITADDGKVKYIKEGDLAWVDAGGDNTFTTANVVVTFLRVLDHVFVMNGEDSVAFLKLDDMTVGKYTKVDDPTVAPTTALTGLTSGSQKIYYAYSYNSVISTTKASPIATTDINKTRDRWKADDTESIKVTRPGTAPTGATSWNLYVATASAGGTIALSDMLPLALGLDLSVTEFVDNGKLEINLAGGTAPEDNGTEGPKASYGIEYEGRPFLYGIKDDPYAIYIGGDGDKAMDFSPNSGGYRLELNKGTNYYPMTVTGFRNGQGLPAITVLFSNTDGTSKQSVISQQTITYGNFSFVVWGSEEQNYGAAGVAGPYSVVNYKGSLFFITTDGIMRMNTQANLQNVLATERISDPLPEEVETIKAGLLNQVVGTAWGNKVIWTAPTRGFSKNDKLLVFDTTHKDNEAWATFDIPAQWVGVVSPQKDPAFIYVCSDNHIYRLQEGYAAIDETPEGLDKPFPFELETGFVGTDVARTSYYALVQTVFYITEFVGEVLLTVTWRDYRSGKFKSKSKKFSYGSYGKDTSGGWSSWGYQFDGNTEVLRWGEVDKVSSQNVATKISKRVVLKLNNVVTNEVKASVYMNADNSAIVVRSISFEGKPLGTSPDIR